MPRLSVTIITRDEAAHIADAIASASWADEVLVVDSGSRDDTVAIARHAGARVLSRDWTGYVDQKNFAAASAVHDWIFSLDADERIPSDLAEEIRAILASDPPAHGYRGPRVTFHLGRWIRTTDFYPDYQTRLYDRRHARWRGRHVHESVAVDGPSGRLRHDLQHYSYRDLADQVERINHYSTLAARQLHENGIRSGLLKIAFHPPAAFLRNYILRRGFLDGTAGLTISLMQAWSVMVKFAKLWEMDRVDEVQHVNSQAPTPNAQGASANSPVTTANSQGER